MPLPLVEFPDLSPEGLRAWSFFHFWDHLEILQAIKSSLGTVLAEYPIDPFFVGGPAQDVTLNLHQQAHADMLGALKIGVTDLNQLDVTNPDRAREWFYRNGQDHQQARAALGI